jgi:outer membrane protein assembly factor BamD (BamD/ComL family)
MTGKRFFAAAVGLVFATLFAGNVYSQGAAKGRIEQPRDEAMEIQAKHNLDVAKWYFEKRKAYAGARDRLMEIIDTYPDFSRMDEVLFLLGEIHLKLSKDDKAELYYSKLLKDYPSSEYTKKAQERLDELKSQSK